MSNHLLRKEVHLFLYTMLSYVLTSIIVVKFGMYLVKYNLNRLQKLQNRAARIISSMSNDVDHSVALHVLGWEPLDITRKKAKARMMYKTLNNIGPESLTKLFHCKNETTKYNLRNISGSLCLPQPRTNSMKNSFMYDGAKLWNSIPKEITESKSLSCFQNKIATHAF